MSSDSSCGCFDFNPCSLGASPRDEGQNQRQDQSRGQSAEGQSPKDNPKPPAFDLPQLLLTAVMSARNNKRTLTAKTTETNRNRLKPISTNDHSTDAKPTAQKKPPAREPFLWFVSLWLNKEMNAAVGPRPDDLVRQAET